MAEQRVQRRLAAILAVDVVGYSRLMGADEPGTLARLMALRRELFEPATKRFGGRIFKTTGDGALAEFPSAADAVSCAVDIQRELAARNAGEPEDQRIELRIGVSLGDVMVAGADLYGNGVNVAARMEGLADPGGVCISGNVHEHVSGAVGLVFDDLGEQQVKNIERPVRCFRVWPALAADAEPQPARPRTSTRSERPAIAVLPFTNMSGDLEQEYFADGMVEDIITGLSRIRWLTVIARNSTFAYKGKAPDIREVGRELAVRYVLEGSVRKAADRVRITAQLIEAETGGHLWADRFDGSLADVFDLLDQITAGVVAAIEPSVRRAETERAKRKRPDNLDVYDLYLRALDRVSSYTPAGRAAALEMLEAAIALDPNYAEAQGVAAFCLQQRFLWGGRAPEDRTAALCHAEAVAGSQTDDATALAFAAFAMSSLAGSHDAAFAMLDRALAHNPSSAMAHTVMAMVNSILGRHDRAEEHGTRALRLSPFDPLRFIPEFAVASAKLSDDDDEAALAGMRRALAANPSFVPARTVEAVCLVRLGRNEEARESVRRVLELSPDTRVATLRERLINAHALGFDRIAAELRAAGLPE
jgi:TolB-like protein/class 3 adenylate cyclase/Tfp pilus assembly protein PilF